MTVSVNANLIFARRRVGEGLQRMRIAAGLKQDDAARLLGVSRFTVSKIERGKAFPTDDQLRVLLTAYEATVEERATIAAEIEQGRSYGRAWWEQPRFHGLYQGDSYRYFALEDAAERLLVHSGTYVPGLLQTRGYMQGLSAFGHTHESTEYREVFVEARLKRQGVLNRQHPASLDAVCLESALRALVGGSEAMRAQLRHLAACAQLPHVSLRVIPFEAGAASVSGYPFTIMEYAGPDIRDVMSQERAGGDRLTDDPAEIRRMRRKFTELGRHALSKEHTIQRIEEIEKQIP